MRKTLPTIALICCLTFIIDSSQAQAPVYQWAKSIEGSVDQVANALAVDASGNVYITGSFEGTIDFDPGTGVFNLISSSGTYDAFVLKLDSSGSLSWAKKLGAASVDYGNYIAVDADGNVYTSGYFDGTSDFDPGSGVYNLTSALNGDVFISKLDSSGNFIWAKAMGGSDFDFNLSMALDAAANVYTTGYYGGTADFDPGSGTYHLSSVSGSADVFISKLDSSGSFVWAKSMGGIYDDVGISITVDDSGNVYSTGYLQDVADFDPGTGTFNLIANGLNDIFISKLDTGGNFAWAKNIGGPSYDNAACIALDTAGNVFTTGSFNGTVDFDPGTGTHNLSSAGNYDIYINKLDASGNFVWARAMGGWNNDGGAAITVDAPGNIFISGTFADTADLDPGAGAYNLISKGDLDFFVSRFDSTGNFTWALSTGGTEEEYSRLALSQTGHLHVAGSYESSAVVFGSTTLTNANPGIYAIYTARLDTTIVTGLNVIESKSFRVYPNPCAGELKIQSLDYDSKIKFQRMEIINMLGEKLYDGQFSVLNSQLRTIDVSLLPPGIYLLRLICEKENYVTKFLKQ